ncbi:hypothetical protein QTP88_002560 [Uroleucon formosanum]
MSPKKANKIIKKKLTINTLRKYFPSQLIRHNQYISQWPRDIESTNETLMSLFRIMWTTNLLIKNFMDSNAVSHSESSHGNKTWIDMESTLKLLHKTIWKLK